MLQKMIKVDILGPKKLLVKTVSALHKIGTIHIEDLSEKISKGEIYAVKTSPDKSLAEKKAELDDIVVKLNSILTFLPELPREKNAKKIEFIEEPIVEAKKFFEEVDTKSKIRDLADRKTQLEHEITSFGKYEVILDKIKPLSGKVMFAEGFETVALIIDKKYREVVDAIKEKIKELTNGRFELISADVDETTIGALLLFDSKYSTQVHSFLWAENINEVKLPKELMNKPFEDIFKTIEAKEESAKEELKKTDAKIKELSREWRAKAISLKDAIQDYYDEIRVYSKIGETDYAFIIEGWVPKRDLNKTKETLEKEFSGQVVLHEKSVTTEELEEAPVTLENPSFAKPFEYFMGILSPPAYGTIDPTIAMSIFFPLFFGMILGDIGYGLVIFVSAILLKRKYPKTNFVQKIAPIMQISSVSAIIFGYFYGELFGEEIAAMIGIHPLSFGHIVVGEMEVPLTLNRIEGIVFMLVLAVGVGVFHVFLGIFFGLVNAIRTRSKKHVIEKIGMFLALFGLFFVIGSIAKIIPGCPTTLSCVMLIIGLTLLIFSTGIMGPIEAVSAMGNILSYARIMAIGLSSAVLAMVANKLGVIVWDMSGSIVVGIIVAGLLHVVNIALGAFSPSIHSLRLHLVEFFGKFYEGGGRRYHPIRAERR